MVVKELALIASFDALLWYRVLDFDPVNRDVSETSYTFRRHAGLSFLLFPAVWALYGHTSIWRVYTLAGLFLWERCVERWERS
jgi:hypothetical protein